MFVGLDLSLTSTGVAKMFDLGMFETKAIRFPALMGVPRIKAVVDELFRFSGVLEWPPTLIAIEGYAITGTLGGNNFHLAELGGVVRYLLSERGMDYIVVTPQHIKQFITGNGAADKVFMGQAVRNSFGADFLRSDWKGWRKNEPAPESWGTAKAHWRDDEVDAFALAVIAAAYAGSPVAPLTPSQTAILGAIRVDPTGDLSKAAKERKLNAQR